MSKGNPYMPRSSTKTKAKFAKNKSPSPGSGDTDTRKERLALTSFVYECKWCDKSHSHSSGYMFVVMWKADWYYFCDVDCCDAWEKSVTRFKMQPEPVTDRRGAIAATRAKNEEDDLRI